MDPREYAAKLRAAKAMTAASDAADPRAYAAKLRAQEEAKAEEEMPGFLDTVLHQGGQGATSYWADELRGKIAKHQIDGDQSEALRDAVGRGVQNDERALLMRMSDKRPVTSFVSNVAGDIGRDFLLSRLGVPVGSKHYQALVGAVSGAGAADAETGKIVGQYVPGTDSIQDDETRGKLAGGVAGLGLGYGGHALGSKVIGPLISKGGGALVRALGQKLQQAGVTQGKKVLLNGADSLSRNLTPDDAVREALRFGHGGELPAILPMGTAKGALKRLEGRAEALGNIYSDIVERLEAAGVKGPEAKALADKMIARAADEELTTGANKAVPSLFMREAQNVENLASAQGGRLGVKQAEKVKQALQSQAKVDYNKTGGGSPLGNARKEVASMVREANEEAIEQAGKAAPFGSEVSELAESFVPVKRRLGRTIAARDAAEKGAQKGANRSFLGLAGKIAALSGNPQSALLGVATGGGMMNRLGSTAASGLYGSGALAGAVGDQLLNMSPAAKAALGSDIARQTLIRLLRRQNQDPKASETP